MLDPCAPEVSPWRHAPFYYTEEHDGLVQPWFGRVFCNPPYGRATGRWLKKCADHGNATALVFARTETKAFREMVWQKADAVMFIHRRISFADRNGNFNDRANAPSCLVAYGQDNHLSLHNCSLPGTVIDLKNGSHTL